MTICFLAAVFIPNISSAMTVIGSTTNPLVGFCLPIIFYLRMDTLSSGGTNQFAPRRLIAHTVNILMIAIGIMSLVLFFMSD